MKKARVKCKFTIEYMIDVPLEYGQKSKEDVKAELEDQCLLHRYGWAGETIGLNEDYEDYEFVDLDFSTYPEINVEEIEILSKGEE